MMDELSAAVVYNCCQFIVTVLFLEQVSKLSYLLLLGEVKCSGAKHTFKELEEYGKSYFSTTL